MDGSAKRCTRALFLLACLSSAWLAHAAPQGGGGVRLFVSGISAEELRSVEAVRWNGAAHQRVAVAVRRDGDTSWLDVAAVCEPGTTFVVTTQSRIGAVTMSDRCAGSERLVLSPRATVTGRFAAHAGVSGLPAFGAAKATCAAGAVEIPFAFDSSKTTELGVPAECGVVSLQVAKLAPVLIPTEVLSTTRPHRLGDVLLKHGASLLARVRSAVDGEPVPELTTIVFRSSDIERLRGEFAEDALRPLARGATDRYGWASFYALSPAEIVLALRRPNQRFPELSEKYLLDAGRGLVIEDLHVSPPASVAVRLVVPDALAEELVLTNVELSPEGENRWPKTAPIAVPALTDGTPSMLEVPPGTWTIAAVVRLKDGFLSRSAAQHLALAPGSHQEVMLQIKDGLFRGRVVRGSEGLRGVLNLLPTEGDAARRQATARTNDDGRFTILLEGPGWYKVDFREPEKGGIRLDRYVEFVDPAKEVEIRLPEGRIRGTVVYENGVPAGKVGVSASRRVTEADPNAISAMEGSATSAADGTFTIENLAGGTWLVRAWMKGVSGDAVEVPLLKDSAADGVLLVVRQTMEVGIHVVDARGRSVANAWTIVERPSSNPHAGQEMESGRTGNDGLARIQLPRSAEGALANIVVSTVDSELSAALVRIDPQRVATVRLPAATGELRLRRSEGKWTDISSARLVADDGSSIPVPTAGRSKASLADDLIRLQRIPAGRWRYIEARSPLDVLAIRALNFSAVQPAAEFTVRQGIVNEIDIPQ
jgi:hypothetical protein